MEFMLFAVIFQFCLFIQYSESNSNSSIEAQKTAKLPPCAACRALTESFKQGMDRTSRGKFEGGDTAWEEEKMKTYKNSEVRLIEIEEKLCSEVVRGQSQCLKSCEEHESLIENWWFNHQNSHPDLHRWLCIDTLAVCCPSNHFGPHCLPCKGGAENPCMRNGRCKGNGTRKGNGECDCSEGYSGELCSECDTGYYHSYSDETKLLCNACHKACQGSCSGAGPKSCFACKTGWVLNQDQGCRDVNECVSGSHSCKDNEYCFNTEGSHMCLKCDRSCDGCTGDGPDMCKKCREGFELEGSTCVDNSGKKREEHMVFARYVTYAGLTIATCIILQKHTAMAAVVGLFVATYITFSEYYLTYLQNDQKNSKSPRIPPEPWGDPSMLST